jgi:hypothetical protein
MATTQAVQKWRQFSPAEARLIDRLERHSSEIDRLWRRFADEADVGPIHSAEDVLFGLLGDLVEDSGLGLIRFGIRQLAVSQRTYMIFRIHKLLLPIRLDAITAAGPSGRLPPVGQAMAARRE